MTRVFDTAGFKKAIKDNAQRLLVDDDVLNQLPILWLQLNRQKIRRPSQTLLRLLQSAVHEPISDDANTATFTNNEIRFFVRIEGTNYRITEIESARAKPLPHQDLSEMNINRVGFPDHLVHQFVIDFWTCYKKNPRNVIREARRLLADTRRYRVWVRRKTSPTSHKVSQLGKGKYLYFRSDLWNFVIMKQDNKFVVILVSPVFDDINQIP
jgi:hypothetical protein